jgi:hypothetical protein
MPAIVAAMYEVAHPPLTREPPLTEQEIDRLMERWDQTAPNLQRKIMAETAIRLFKAKRALAEAQHALADARPPLTRELTESQLSLLSDVAGLCHSEANRWERSAPKTSEHWRKAAVELQAAYLAAHAMLADGLTRERVAEAVRELFPLPVDRRTTRRWFESHDELTAELCRLLGVDAIAAARPAGPTRGEE